LPLFLLGCSEQVEVKTPEQLEEERLIRIHERKMDSLNNRIDSIRKANDIRQLEYERQLRRL